MTLSMLVSCRTLCETSLCSLQKSLTPAQGWQIPVGQLPYCYFIQRHILHTMSQQSDLTLLYQPWHSILCKITSAPQNLQGTKSYIWLHTPHPIRTAGGSLFYNCDSFGSQTLTLCYSGWNIRRGGEIKSRDVYRTLGESILDSWYYARMNHSIVLWNGYPACSIQRLVIKSVICSMVISPFISLL